ncbi:hypothetical protein H696_04602 [Fonticula alba]|uniref:Uncharacterized protein n=1 Tax=Fonticula alba TaxID=691883 RepID=A0A058Z6N3_FONAL|nr:hypothetical protein H696_04602 [Fonticula alba]KCV69192.1 hypothetical protein H696_04602 [Fonticula alba]|eukprot:XP_009496763.1 hypothetical protein H696_04602 [Fonticula alba]
MSLIPRLVESIKRLHQDLQTERARHAVNDEFDRLRLHVTDRARPTSQLLGTPSAAATLNAEHERIERERRELQARAERLRVERDRLKVLQAAQDEAVATNQVGGPLDFAPGGSASAGATAVSTPPPALHGSGGGHYQHHTGAGAGAPVSPIITTPLLYSPDMHSHLHHQQPVSATQVSTPTGMAPPPVLVSPGGLLLTPLSTTAPHPTGPSAAGPHAGGPSSHLATAPDHLSGSHLASPSSATPPLQYSNSAHSLSLASTPEPGSSPGMSSPTGAAACPESNFARSDSSINERAHHHAYGSADANATGGTAVPLSPFAPMAGTESNFRASIDCSSQSFSQLRSTFGG